MEWQGKRSGFRLEKARQGGVSMKLSGRLV